MNEYIQLYAFTTPKKLQTDRPAINVLEELQFAFCKCLSLFQMARCFLGACEPGASVAGPKSDGKIEVDGAEKG